MRGYILRSAAFGLAFGLSLQAVAQTAAPRNPDIISTREQAQQSEAVKKRFADIDYAMKSPALEPGRTTFTNQDELVGFLAEVAASSPRAALLMAGTSQQGRDIPFMLFTAEGADSLAEAAKLPRPVLWFIGQQHGNEPAGGEGMLALAQWLGGEEAKPLLDRVTIAVLPRANPDGAHAFERGTANKADLNRDHLLQFLPESQALHKAMAALPPDVVFDHHEFSVVNRWLEKFQAIQAVDAMVLHATNPMVPREISGLAEDLFRPAVDQAFKARGLSMFWYYTTSNRRSDRVVSMGGNNPGIARNAFGLRGAVSFLIETRGVGIGMDGWQRRVASHVIAARAVIEAAAANAEKLRAGIDAGRAATAKAAGDLVIAARIPAKPLTIPLIDPESGADKPTEVPFQDSRVIEPTQTRPRAAGYFVTAGEGEAVTRLRMLGIRVCRLAEARTLELDSYRLDEVKQPTDREQINPDQAIKATIIRKPVTLPAGALFVPMAQPGAGIVAATLEVDTPGSYLSTGVIAQPAGTNEAPVFSLPRGVAVPVRPDGPDDREACPA